MPGRGRGGKTGNLTAIASNLGIQRSEISSYGQVLQQGPPPLFPPLDSKPLRQPVSDDVQYMAEVKQELLNRFQDSPYYLHATSSNNDIKRYTDKYRAVTKESWLPNWNQLPLELKWGSRKHAAADAQAYATKKRRVETQSDKIDARLNELEKLDDKLVTDDPVTEPKKAKEEEEEDEQNKSTEQEVLSDDDYLEEDNDYIDNYFDNGEGYMDESEDNLDDDAVY